MEAEKIQAAMVDISTERDPTLKSVKLGFAVTALWAECDVQLW